MAIKQDTDGTWRIQIDRKGMPRKRRGGFATKEEAELFERNYLAEHRVNYEQAMDVRTLKELIESWFMYHGINLADGERRQRKLLQMASELKNPVASQLHSNFVELIPPCPSPIPLADQSQKYKQKTSCHAYAALRNVARLKLLTEPCKYVGKCSATQSPPVELNVTLPKI